MTVKEKIHTMIRIHTGVVTGIFLFLCIFLPLFSETCTLKVVDLLGVQLVGIISAILYLPWASGKEFSKGKMLVFTSIHGLCINATVLIVGNYLEWFSFKNSRTFIGIEVMFLLIFFLMTFFEYSIESNQAKEMNKKIQQRKKEN